MNEMANLEQAIFNITFHCNMKKHVFYNHIQPPPPNGVDFIGILICNIYIYFTKCNLVEKH